MGCCLSSTTERRLNTTEGHHSPLVSRPSLEEETVKEVVISQTHVAVPKLRAPDDGLLPKLDNPEPEEKEEAKTSPVNGKPAENEGGGEVGAVDVALKDASEYSYSEFCSLSESLSTATTVTEIREEEVTSRSRDRDDCQDLAGVQQKVRRKPILVKPPRPPLRELRYASEEGKLNRRMLNVSNGPRSLLAQQNRRPSPIRTQATTRIAPRSPTPPRNCPGNVGYESGRKSYGRSGSPSIRRSPTRVAGSSVIGSIGSKDSTGTDGGNKENLDQENRVKKAVEEANGDVSKKGSNRESLENPLVSLECFIFI